MSLVITSLLQAIGDGGQGWGNLILYVFGTKQLRDKLLWCGRSKGSPKISEQHGP